MRSESIILRHIIRNRWPYMLGFALLSISCLLNLFIPMLLGSFTDLLSANELTLQGTIWYAAMITIVGLGIAVLRSTSRIYLFRFSRKLEMNVRGDLFSHWERMSAQYFSNRRIGDLMAHAISDVSVIREVTMQGIFQVMEAFVLITMAVIAMSTTIDPWLTLFTMLPLPFLSVVAYRFNQRIQRESNDVQNAIGRLTSRVQEFTAGIRIVKAFVQERKERKLFNDDNEHAVEMNIRFARSNSLFGALSSAIVGITFLVSVIMGGMMVIRGSITMGDFVAFHTYLALLTGPIENLGRVVNLMQRGKASEDRLLGIFRTEPDIADGEDVDISVASLEGEIDIRGLTFSYPNQPVPALSDIHLHVPEGTSLALVGRVGSGKSTLVNLLARVYDPPKGTIYIDGMELQRIPLSTLRSEIGFVPQDQFLFSSTIRDNIAFAPLPFTDDEVTRASQVAHVYNNIVEFPHKFETALGERGISLSGGQRQRVSIARAVIKKPSVLVFDDSLSAVDTETEEMILEQLKGEIRQRTTIIIGHRISSVQSADQIIVLDEGRIVERGNHESLLRDDGIYADMYRKQLLEEAKEGVAR